MPSDYLIAYQIYGNLSASYHMASDCTKLFRNSIGEGPVFSHVLFAAEPPPDEGEASGVGKYVSSASSALGQGAKKAGPILAKVGSALLSALRKLGKLAMKGLRGSIGAIKSRFSGNREMTPPRLSSVDEEPKNES